MPSRLQAPTVILWAATLTLGAAGGFALDLLHVPLAWLLGSLGAVAAAGLCGVGLSVPPGGRQVGQLLLGTAIGLTFTSAVAEAVAGLECRVPDVREIASDEGTVTTFMMLREDE